jgi:hypothetical protein
MQPGWHPTIEAPLLSDIPVSEKAKVIARPLGRAAQNLALFEPFERVRVVRGAADQILHQDPYGPYDNSFHVLPDDVTLSAALDLLSKGDEAIHKCRPLIDWVQAHDLSSLA